MNGFDSKSWWHECFSRFSQQAPRGCRKWWPSYPTEETHTCPKPSQTGLGLLGWSNIISLRYWRRHPSHLESSPHTCLITCWAWHSRAPKPRSYTYISSYVLECLISVPLCSADISIVQCKPSLTVALCPLPGHLCEQKSQRCVGVLLSLPQNGQLPPWARHISRIFKSIPGGHMWDDVKEKKRYLFFSTSCNNSWLNATYKILSHLFVSVSYGSWFDHVKEWTSQTATMSNLLHITYEEMLLVKKNWSKILIRLFSSMCLYKKSQGQISTFKNQQMFNIFTWKVTELIHHLPK